jgi:nucleotide-binding universal stress UspA family protein
MSIKDILVHLDVSDKGSNVSDFAISLAAEFGAHLTAAGVVVEIMPPASFMGEFPYDLMLEAADQARAVAQTSFEQLQKSAPASVGTELVVIDSIAGQVREEFGRLARHFDLSVVGQGDPEIGGDDQLVAEGALFGSSRPVFVVPYTHSGSVKLGKAMIAWDGGMAAARAVADALPLLKRAGHVEVVSIASKRTSQKDLPGFNITRHLSRHGISATLRKLPNAEDAGAALLSHAADSGADYIVMGGYGHSHLRELVFGGATRTIFQSMTIPVFMAH